MRFALASFRNAGARERGCRLEGAKVASLTPTLVGGTLAGCRGCLREPSRCCSRTSRVRLAYFADSALPTRLC
jgi:hypothetical protein